MTIDDKFLDALQGKAKESPRLRMHYDLRNTPEDQSQRILNALEPGTVLPIHRHMASSETVFLLRGRLDEIFYDGEGRETERYHLDPLKGVYGCDIPSRQWHSIEVFEPSVIIEMKDGPYRPEDSEFLEKP